MRKLLMFAAIAVLSMNVSFAQESSSDSGGIHFGVKAGVNFSTISEDNDLAHDITGRISFQVGAVIEIPISEKFLIQPEIVYSTQGFNTTFNVGGSNFDATGKLDYINIPVMAGYRIIDGLTAHAGPQIGINISAKYFDNDGDSVDMEDIETIDIGFGFGAQYQLDFGLFFQARYVVGLSKIDKDFESKNRVGSISVGYFFN